MSTEAHEAPPRSRFAIRIVGGQYLHHQGRCVAPTTEQRARQIAFSRDDSISIVTLTQNALGVWFASSEIDLSL